MSLSAKQKAASDDDVRTLGPPFLERMLQIREFENAVQRLFEQGLVRGSTHLCQGQEAVPVGVCSVLADSDSMTCTYRGHGAVIAKGAPLDRAFAEILGRESGLCGGKGGSMHLTDVRVGAYGSFAIVGAHLPMSVGLAFASMYRKTSEVSVCFFGDGTANIGAFHESLNMAALWKLPVIFIIENNLYGEYSPWRSTTSVDRLVDRAEAYAMRGTQVDGNDVFAVREVAKDAILRARRGEGPTLVEALTYRQVGHSRSDPGKYRPPGELEAWLERDPIRLLELALQTVGLSKDELATIRARAQSDVAAALERAKSSPEPSLDSRLTNVFT